MGRRLASLPSHVQITRLRSIIKIFDKHVLIYKTALYSLTSSELVTETKYEGCEILSLRSATHTLLRFRLIRSVFTAIWMSLKRRRPDSCPTCMSSPQTFETIRFLTSGLRQFSVCVDQINLCRSLTRAAPHLSLPSVSAPHLYCRLRAPAGQCAVSAVPLSA